MSYIAHRLHNGRCIQAQGTIVIRIERIDAVSGFVGEIKAK